MKKFLRTDGTSISTEMVQQTNGKLSKWGNSATYFHIMKFQRIEGKEKILKVSRVGVGERSRLHSDVKEIIQHQTSLNGTGG